MNSNDKVKVEQPMKCARCGRVKRTATEQCSCEDFGGQDGR